MSSVLRFVGSVWAGVGFWNLVLMPWNTGSQVLLGVGIMFNVLLFVLPGLAVAGIGSAIARRRGGR